MLFQIRSIFFPVSCATRIKAPQFVWELDLAELERITFRSEFVREIFFPAGHQIGIVFLVKTACWFAYRKFWISSGLFA
jgi:hypothetical protein